MLNDTQGGPGSYLATYITHQVFRPAIQHGSVGSFGSVGIVGIVGIVGSIGIVGSVGSIGSGGATGTRLHGVPRPDGGESPHIG